MRSIPWSASSARENAGGRVYLRSECDPKNTQTLKLMGSRTTGKACRPCPIPDWTPDIRWPRWVFHGGLRRRPGLPHGFFFFKNPSGVDASCLCDAYLAGRQALRQAAYARTRRENGLLQIKFVLTADFPSVNREVTRHDKCVFPYLGVQTMVKHTSCSCLIRPQKSDFLPIESVDSLQIDSSTTHRMFPRQIYIPEIGHICNIFRSWT